MEGLAPLLIAYDAECALCRRAVDWVQRRDAWGLVIPFPLQNPELVRMAPELAGRPLHLELHGLDTKTREIWAGASLMRPILARLPRWRWLAPVFGVPGLASLASSVYQSVAARRYRPTGRRPFER